MKNIGELLFKIRGLDQKRKDLKKLIKDVVLETTQVDLEDNQIVFKEGLISLKVFGSARNEIFLNKKSLEENLNTKIKGLWGGEVKIVN